MAKNITLDPEEFCLGEPVKTITIPVVVVAPTITQVRKWLTSQGWEMTPLISPFEKWTKGPHRTQLPNNDSYSDWCESIQRWIGYFADISKHTDTSMTAEYIYRSIVKEAP